MKAPFIGYYEKIIKPAASKHGLDAIHAGEVFGTNPIVADIWAKVWAARVVVAEVTDRNPNVNYELGLCHALGVPTIIITQTIEDVPFDYRHRRCLVYDRSDPDWSRTLAEGLSKTLASVLTESESDPLLQWPYSTDPQSIAAVQELGINSASRLFEKGVKRAIALIEASIGPRGRLVRVDSDEHSMSSRRGFTILRALKAQDPVDRAGVRLLQDVAGAAFQRAGDGSKIGTLIAAKILTEGMAAIESGVEVSALVDGVEEAGRLATLAVKKRAMPLKGGIVRSVGVTASFSAEIGSVVSDVLEQIGPDGLMSIETVDSPAAYNVKIEQGVQLPRGLISPHLITDPDRMEAVLEEPYILFTEDRLSSMGQILPLLEQVAKADASLLIVAEAFDQEVISTLVTNKLKGTLKVAAVQAPNRGDHRRALLEDLAVLCGGTSFTKDLARLIERARLSDLGRARRAVVGRDSTEILDGAGTAEAVKLRSRQIAMQIDSAEAGPDRFALQERLARLAGAVAVVQIGGRNATERDERASQFSAAMHSTYQAIRTGFVAGGGVALIQARDALAGEISANSSRQRGIDILREALTVPVRQLVATVYGAADTSWERVRDGKGTLIFDVFDGTIKPTEGASIFDPAGMLVTSVEQAVYFACQALRTGRWHLNEEARPAPARWDS